MQDNEESSKEELSKEVRALLIEGKKIGAIKVVREQSGLGLKEAKDLVESYMLKHPEIFPKTRAASSGSRALIYGLVILAALLTYEFVSQYL